MASNWRSEENAEHFLSENGIPVAAEIDTRALVRHLRTRGVMRAAFWRWATYDRKQRGGTRAAISVNGRPGSGYACINRIEIFLGPPGDAVLRLRRAGEIGGAVLPRGGV